MSDNTANSKRIAKNTLLLYIRMIFLMLVSLYTSRVVLAALGVDDYGIYNVVGGIVTMFTVISASLSTAISRFITFELGKENQQRLNTIFSTSIIIQIIMAIAIAVLVETIGMWFLLNKLVIPPDRLSAAQWVLQISLFTLIINLISIPYRAAIIAHERMGAFAYISIFEALGQLLISYFISIAPIDKLIFYAISMSLIAIIVRFIYSIYCNKHFEECKFRFVFDKRLFKEMFSFAGWNFIGSSAGILRDQGGNMLLNIFAGGPIVNAAVGISNQVKHAVILFSTNFMMAMNPQITKSYASGNREYMMNLIFKGARYSFYLLLTISLPILISTPYILELWLKDVPDYTVVFVRLALVIGMVESLSNPLITAMLATGKVKKYQIIVGGVQLLNIPISYLFLNLGFSPTSVLIVALALSFVCLFFRLYLLQEMIDLSFIKYFKNVFVNVMVVTLISVILPFYLRGCIADNLVGFISVSFICIIITLLVIFLVGCNKKERYVLYFYLRGKLLRR